MLPRSSATSSTLAHTSLTATCLPQTVARADACGFLLAGVNDVVIDKHGAVSTSS